MKADVKSSGIAAPTPPKNESSLLEAIAALERALDTSVRTKGLADSIKCLIEDLLDNTIGQEVHKLNAIRACAERIADFADKAFDDTDALLTKVRAAQGVAA